MHTEGAIVNIKESLSIWTLPVDTHQDGVGGGEELPVFQTWPSDVERESNLSLVSRGGKGSRDWIVVHKGVTSRLLCNKAESNHR